MFDLSDMKWWKSMLEVLNDGVIFIDESGKILWVNRSIEQMSGYSSEELIGQPCSMLAWEMCGIELANCGDGWCALFRDGKLERKRGFLQRKDGARIPVLKNASLLRDKNNGLAGAVETITDISELSDKDRELSALKKAQTAARGFKGIIGSSPGIRKVFDMLLQTADSDSPVIILGETGTGKELVAQAIHDLGPRVNKPLVKVNCSALSESLMESELFGHVKGAYTGAYAAREGRFEEANGGEIFLDEIGDIPHSFQVKLLRIIEDKIVQRVGSNKDIPVDFRLISATNRNVADLVDAGAFRKDLFYRINTIPINVPPLRERQEDIPALTQHFLELGRISTGKQIAKASDETIRLMMNYSWPGNVRELKGTVEYFFVICKDIVVEPKHLPPAILRASKSTAGIQPDQDNSSITQQRIMDAISASGGNQTKAARLLGVSRITLWKWIKKFNIDVKSSLKDAS
jgi:two-component system response regulator HydG